MCKGVNELKKYIDTNSKRPSRNDGEDKTKAFGNWMDCQQKNYIKKEQIMKNEKIYNKWTEFMNDNKYKIYFMSNEDEWLEKLNQIEKYIDTNNKKPCEKNKDGKIKTLGIQNIEDDVFKNYRGRWKKN